jgi:hypothetical protein
MKQQNKFIESWKKFEDETRGLRHMIMEQRTVAQKNILEQSTMVCRTCEKFWSNEIRCERVENDFSRRNRA